MSSKTPIRPIEIQSDDELIATINRVAINLKPLSAVMMDVINQTCERHGWNDDSPNKGEMIALEHSELSERLEWVRKGHDIPSDHLAGMTGEEEEVADLIIRALHYSALFGLRISETICNKIKFNINRSFKHGGKLF